MVVTEVPDREQDLSDEQLRQKLWTLVAAHLQPLLETAREDTNAGRHESFAAFIVIRLWEKLLKDKWLDYLKSQAETDIPKDPSDINAIAGYFQACSSSDARDLVEFVARSLDRQQSTNFCEQCNQLFERARSGFRFVNTRLVPISQA